MASEFPTYPSQDAANFVRFNSECEQGSRPFIEPHFIEEGGERFLLVPSMSVMFGQIIDEATGNALSTLRMRSAMAHAGLLYIFFPDELRILGKAMIEQADALDEAARVAAKDLLDRAMSGRKDK